MQYSDMLLTGLFYIMLSFLQHCMWINI